MTTHRYTFTAPMPGGPWRRVFDCPHAFDNYVRAWMEDMGPVWFESPWVARGAL